jgi:hypothetical protein
MFVLLLMICQLIESCELAFAPGPCQQPSVKREGIDTGGIKKSETAAAK